MSAGDAVAVILAAGAGGLVVLLTGIDWVIRIKRQSPTVGEVAGIMFAVAGTVFAVVLVMWPDMPADPLLVVPDGPVPDPFAGYDSSELP